MNDYLSLAASVLTACEPQQRRRERAPDTYGGPLWAVKVPVASSVVRRVIEYAHQQQVSIGGVTGRLASLKGTDDGLVVTIAGDVWDRGVAATLTVGYANDTERKLATGQWVAAKYGSVRLTRLMPEVEPTGYGAKVLIGAEFKRDGWFSRLTSASLSHIELHYTKAVPVLSSRLKTWLAPDVVFVEPAVEVGVK